MLHPDFPKEQPIFQIKRSAANAELKRTSVIVEEPEHLTSVALTGDTSDICMASEYHEYLKDTSDGPMSQLLYSESSSSHSSRRQSSLSTHEDTSASDAVTGYAHMASGNDTSSSHLHAWKDVTMVSSCNTFDAAHTFVNSDDAVDSSLPSTDTIETYSDGITASPLPNINTSDAAQTFANSDDTVARS